MQEKKRIYVEVILPISIGNTFTYHLNEPASFESLVGKRVVVSFGRGILYTGIVYKTGVPKPELYKTKEILYFLDTLSVATENQLKLWQWTAKYYFCALGDVYRNVFPSALRLDSETFLSVREDSIEEDLPEIQQQLFDFVKAKQKVSLKEVLKHFKDQKLFLEIRELIANGFLQTSEELKHKYKPKVQKFVQVTERVLKETQNSDIWDTLGRSPKQREVLLKFISSQLKEKKPVLLQTFLSENKTSTSVVEGLQNKGYVEIFKSSLDRFSLETDENFSENYALTNLQNKALEQIREAFKQKDVTLLHGVSASGKTEIYLKLILETLKQGKKVLVLLPEVSIASQIVERLQNHFKHELGVFHGKLSQNERTEVYLKSIKNKWKVIVGVRSAVFLPIQDLGLIIVDEEHSSSYKQEQQKPYYNAKDVALVRAKNENAKVLLGSATPSLESFYSAKEEKYASVTLPERFDKKPPTEIKTINLREEKHKKRMKGVFSKTLLEAISETLEKGQQVMLYQNRKGYAPVMECNTCGYVAGCENCDISLTYYSGESVLKCHYCGHKRAKPLKCPSCQSTDFVTKGLGTEQIEEAIQREFPERKIERMDAQSMRKKHAYEKLFERFSTQSIDILVGTQMLSKGLDFKNVGLVAMIQADSELNFPSFRAHENAFQQMVQLAGRAGRSKVEGKMLIQTSNPSHEVFDWVKSYDYNQMANKILEERTEFLYPPFVRIISITLKHKNKERVQKVAAYLAELLRVSLKDNLLGPQPAMIEKRNNEYYRQMLVKISPKESPAKVKAYLKDCLEKLEQVSVFKTVNIKIDVDVS